MKKHQAWLLPSALLLLLAVPLLAGLYRLFSLASDPAVTPDNARFVQSPLPAVVHILASLAFGILGAFQVTPAIRKKKPAWHLAAGRWAMPAAWLSALSGLWLTQAYPAAPDDGPALYGIRWIVGLAMLVFLAQGLVALKQRKYAKHGAWMLRAYALGMGAGTQVFTHVFWMLFLGKPTGWSRDFLMAAGWMINVLVAEWLLARRPLRSALARQ